RRSSGRRGQTRRHRPVKRRDRDLRPRRGDLMRALVTGASGRIGKALCGELLARGDEVVGLTRDPGKAAAAQSQVTWQAWEPMLERPAEAAFEGVDGVVNLVGEKINQRWTEEAKRKIIDSRRVATHNLAAAIEGLATKPKVVVSQS